MKYVRQQPFESFNARTLTPSEVAGTFVPPPCFASLIGRKHSVLVGPRGSGKTTLLKMLHPAAIRAWKHAEADRARTRVTYTGVFIPFDRSWSEQLKALDRNVPYPEVESLGISAFTTHVLRAFVSSLSYVVRPDDVADSVENTTDISRDQEVEIVSRIAESWYLSPDVATFGGLHLALTDRLADIAELRSRLQLMSEKDAMSCLQNESYLHLQFLAALSSGIERVEEVVGDTGQWALLFDELELAPPGIFQLLVRSLRSADSRFIFKLSLSPYTPNFETTIESAMPGHDYDLLTLWYPRKEDSYKFCREIVQQMIAGRDLEQRTVEEVFGRSIFEGETEIGLPKKSSAYSPGSSVQKRFSDLAGRDQSFDDYLTKQDIDLEKIAELAESERAQVRKLVAVVTVRETYFKEKSATSRSQLRSRKNPTLYSGATVMFDISEGNPRLLIGLVDRLLDHRKDSGKVPRNQQSSEIRASLARFRAYLKTVPILESNTPVAGTRGLLSFIDKIGRHFSDQVHGAEFNPEPALSFVVDSTASDVFVEALANAMNAGAIIEVSELDGSVVSGNLRGTRFRLAYLLATQYRLPLLLGRSHSLKEIVSAANNQGELF